MATLLPQLLEEAGITATAMQHCGMLHFHFDDKPQPWEVHGERPCMRAPLQMLACAARRHPLHAHAAAAPAARCR